MIIDWGWSEGQILFFKIPARKPPKVQSLVEYVIYGFTFIATVVQAGYSASA